MGKPKSVHKTTLVKAVRSMGISFEIRNKEDSKEKECTSLMEMNRKKDLPANFH